MRRLVVTALLLLGATAASAFADGPGLTAIGTSVVLPGSRLGYTTAISRDSKHTRVARWTGKRLDHEARLDGSYGVPYPVARADRAALSHDGGTLVLARIDRPGFAVLDARTLQLRRTIPLRGFFSFDALSPHGRTLYLIQHVSSHYYVRAYDVAAGRLLDRIVFDAREKSEPMTGLPMTRAVGPSGRWAYTLYRRSDGTLFVHSLDTVDRHAYCVDVPRRATAAQAARLRLHIRGLRLLVTADWATRPLAVIDRTTLRLAL